MEMPWWTKCTDVSLLQFKKDVLEEDEIVVEERSSLQSWVSAAQSYCAEESS